MPCHDHDEGVDDCDGVDNDGDGLIDEDGWDGVDNDGDCLMLNASYQDSNGDGIPCGPGDLGVDEDFSEQFITDMVNTCLLYTSPSPRDVEESRMACCG